MSTSQALNVNLFTEPSLRFSKSGPWDPLLAEKKKACLLNLGVKMENLMSKWALS